jgi:hypothetical protein
MFRRKRFLNFLGVKGWGAIFRRKRFLNRTFNVFSKEEEEANLPVPCQYVISTCPGARCPSILTPTETSSYGDLYHAVVLSCCCLSVTLARVVAGFYSKPTAGGLLPPLPQDSGARP